MKNIAKYILMAGVALMATACDKDSVGTGEGAVSFDFRMSSETRAVVDAATLPNVRVKVYREDGGLIRRYTSVADIPAPLYLVAGEYSVTAEAGDKENVAFLASDVAADQGVGAMLCYASEAKPFTVAAQQNSNIEVVAKTINVKTTVEFNTAATDNENSQLSDVKIQLAAMTSAATDVAAFNAALTAETPKVEMSGSDTAYFLLPEGETEADNVTTILWAFEATHAVDGAISKVGTINVEKGKGYTVKFKYSRTPDGFVGPDEDGNGGLYVEVDDSVEEYESDFDFKPQPEITGAGLNISGVNVYTEGSNVVLTCESINDLATLSLGGVNFFAEGEVVANAIAGVTCVKNASTKVTITLAKEYFASMTGGENTLVFGMTDTGGEYSQKIKFLKQGLVEVDTTFDLWSNIANFTAVVTESATSVQVMYKNATATEWNTLAATKQADGYTYKAVSGSPWVTGTANANHQIWDPNKSVGVYANNNYEYKLVVDGVEKAVSSRALTTDQTIPYATFEDNTLACWGNDTGVAPYWGSGNNSFTDDDPLCRQATYNGMTGSYCAQLSSCAAGALGITMLAAGNIFTGTFSKPSTTGTVSFGIKYNWKARPTAMKLKYWGNIGTVDRTDKDVVMIPSGQPDQASIYVAIIDWSSRHQTSSGTGNPSGIWSVEDGINAVSEGKIIGYGVVYPTGTTSGDKMIDLEIPIHYYDTQTKPSGNYTLVISAATSRYGDYMNGCSKSDMYVDDFQWVY